MKLWCAAWQVDVGGKRLPDPVWCACEKQPHRYYDDNIKTACSHVIGLATGIEYREPTCKECRRVLGILDID